MIKVIAKKSVQNGKVEEVIKLYEELVAASRKEEGCIKYELYQDEASSTVLAVMEEWESNEALERHKNTEHFLKIVPQIIKFASTIDFTIYHKVI